MDNIVHTSVESVSLVEPSNVGAPSIPRYLRESEKFEIPSDNAIRRACLSRIERDPAGTRLLLGLAEYVIPLLRAQCADNQKKAEETAKAKCECLTKRERKRSQDRSRRTAVHKIDDNTTKAALVNLNTAQQWFGKGHGRLCGVEANRSPLQPDVLEKVDFRQLWQEQCEKAISEKVASPTVGANMVVNADVRQPISPAYGHPVRQPTLCTSSNTRTQPIGPAAYGHPVRQPTLCTSSQPIGPAAYGHPVRQPIGPVAHVYQEMVCQEVRGMGEQPARMEVSTVCGHTSTAVVGEEVGSCMEVGLPLTHSQALEQSLTQSDVIQAARSVQSTPPNRSNQAVILGDENPMMYLRD